METQNGGIGTEFAIDSMGQQLFVESLDTANGGLMGSNEMESCFTNEYSHSLGNPLLP